MPSDLMPATVEEQLLPLPSGTTPQSAGVAHAFQQRLSWPELEATAAPFGWRLEHISATIGTVVHGVDCAAVGGGGDAPAVAALRTLFNERGALFFRDQPLSRRQHLGFARQFGPLLGRHPFTRPSFRVGRHPDGNVEVIQIVHDENSIGAENNWHTDLSAQREPPASSLLHAKEAPSVGGDTVFADMEAAFAGLSEETQRRLSTMRAGHKLNPVTTAILAANGNTDDLAWFREHFPGNLLPAPDNRLRPWLERADDVVEHPLVRAHPEVRLTSTRSLATHFLIQI